MPGRDARTGAPRAQERTQPRPASSKRPAAAGEEPRSDYSRKRRVVCIRHTIVRLRHTAYETMFPLSDVIPSRTFPIVTIGLIVVNALVFLHELLLPAASLEMFMQQYALIPAWFSWPTLLTSMFLHAGFWHVAANMLY